MKKRIIAALCAGSLALSLAACGGSTSESTSSEAVSSSSEAVSAASEAAG